MKRSKILINDATSLLLGGISEIPVALSQSHEAPIMSTFRHRTNYIYIYIYRSQHRIRKAWCDSKWWNAVLYCTAKRNSDSVESNAIPTLSISLFRETHQLFGHSLATCNKSTSVYPFRPRPFARFNARSRERERWK